MPTRLVALTIASFAAISLTKVFDLQASAHTHVLELEMLNYGNNREPINT